MGERHTGFVTAEKAWSAAYGAALQALRLNHQYPPWRPLAETVAALSLSGQLRFDPMSGLLAAREWLRARADRALASETLASLGDLADAKLPMDQQQRFAQKRAYLQALLATEPPPPRKVAVVLRHVGAERAGYRVSVDRIDVATGTVARYTLLLEDRPGERISEGELSLSAHGHFESLLSVLSTQDAALAFAVLREQGVGVQEVVRGVIGPAKVPEEALAGFASGFLLSAKLERVSVELRGGVVDDPLPGSVTVPTEQADFGLVVLRKWAVPQADVARMKAALADRGSRNLVYGYALGGR